MKSSSLVPGRFALSRVAAAALCLAVPSAWALGLGTLVVQSSLGEGLRAEIDVSSLTPEEAANLKVRVAAPEAYRAAGVEYNAVLPTTQVVLQRRADGRPYLRLSSDRAVQEPFVDVILELNWNTGRLVREYTLLFDPPVVRAQAPAPAPATPPVIAAALPAAPRAPAAPPEARPAAPPIAARAAEAKSPPPNAPPAPAAVAEARKAPAAPAATLGEGYRVKPGDTLSGIAGRTQPQGLSLDQMLVALYRANPQAFIDNNMNRLKSGVVLAVPDAEAAKAASPAEARQVIQAQSADFAAYRQRLAGAVAPAATEVPSRQASGKVQAAVEDRKQASAPTPDKLTLSKGGANAQASAPEDRLSKERESKDASARAAELKKNVDELQKLAAATKPAAAPAPAPAPAPAASAAPAPTTPTATAPVTARPAASAVTADAAPAAPAAASAPAAVSVATARPAAPEAASAAAAPAPAPKEAAAAPRPAAAPATAPEEPGLMGTLLDDPLALTGGGLVLALLAGFGVYRYVKRSRKDGGETSFLESRLQPDSFFGVSGGQHIDTRESTAGTASSSMSYSLSQLDAIGDVDPVAEADVYLAYGRDLQAEEILKEAIRSTPGRMAIRTKLLEVYAKRRDTKGFELLALQLFSLTRGEGEDWARAQELGTQIDPDNPLYQPGGRPDLPTGEDGVPIEPLGASTMPQSVLPSPSQFGQAAMSTMVTAPPAGADVDLEFDLDLDLDLDKPATAAAVPSKLPETTQPMPAPVAPTQPDAFEFDLPLEAPPAPFAPSPSVPPRDLSLDFDLAGISLDLDAPPPSAESPTKADALELPDVTEDGGDPFERKLELAEEFRQIGDTDGARDLLEEVIAQTGGAIQAKARNMLDRLI